MRFWPDCDKTSGEVPKDNVEKIPNPKLDFCSPKEKVEIFSRKNLRCEFNYVRGPFMIQNVLRIIVDLPIPYAFLS